jgi:hypothetical protein
MDRSLQDLPAEAHLVIFDAIKAFNIERPYVKCPPVKPQKDCDAPVPIERYKRKKELHHCPEIKDAELGRLIFEI